MSGGKQAPPFADAAGIERANANLGVGVEEFVRLDHKRRVHIMHRVAEWDLVDPGTLNAESARNMFTEARHIVALLISDHCARRPWWRRALGLR